MELSGDERKELREAIISAYPNEGKLVIFVSEELDENLNKIAGGDDLNQIVFNLIQWSKKEGKLKELIEAAYKANPGNEKLKAIKQKLLPSIFDAAGVSFKVFNFPEEDWDNLVDIISEINSNLRAQVCHMTLENIAKNQDVSGNYPELKELKKVSTLKTIFLDKCPQNDKGAPTIIEFAERLIKEKEIEEDARLDLKNWVETVAQKLQVSLPTYSEVRLTETVQSYLLITAIYKGKNQFHLVAELICDENNQTGNNKPIKIDFKEETPKIDCSLTELIDKIDDFIRISKRDYLNPKYEDYNLIVELFLPLRFLDYSIDIEKISAGFKEKRAIAYQCQFIIRSIERITENDGGYLVLLRKRWKVLANYLQKNPTWKDFYNKFEHISQKDNTNSLYLDWESCNWDEMENYWSEKESLGLKITCNLPTDDEAKRKFFIAFIRSGVPISLWTRCRTLANLETEFNEIFAGKSESLSDLNSLCESVWRIRKKAHAKKDEDKQNYLGYHLGFLCDNPDRIPFNLKEQNQLLVETGQ